MTNTIYRAYEKNDGFTSYARITDIDIATGNAKGIDLYTGKKVTIKYNRVFDKVYFTEQEIKTRFPNYKVA